MFDVIGSREEIILNYHKKLIGSKIHSYHIQSSRHRHSHITSYYINILYYVVLNCLLEFAKIEPLFYLQFKHNSSDWERIELPSYQHKVCNLTGGERVVYLLRAVNSADVGDTVTAEGTTQPCPSKNKLFVCFVSDHFNLFIKIQLNA